MKKIILTIMACLFTIASVNATTYTPASRVSTVGAQIISKNGLPTVKYSVVSTDTVNTNIATTKTLQVSKTKLNYAGNDNETAAVISQEIGAIVNAAASKKSFISSVSNSVLSNISDEKLQNLATLTQQISLSNMSEKDQMDADITGVDLMIKAGYNPLAMIVILGKMEGSLRDALQMQPANLKRTMNIYDYLSYNYPAKVKAGYACNEYRNFVAYIQPTITKRNSNKKELAKFQKTQAKAKKDRERQLLRYKVTGGTNGWDVTKSLLEGSKS